MEMVASRSRQAKANPPDQPAPSRLLALKVARSGNDMEISWDRFSEVMNNASGTLTIRDGPVVRVVALSSNQLREGHIWFAPLPGSDLDLRLEIVKKDGKTEAESVQVLNWDRSSPVAPSTKKNSSVARALERNTGGIVQEGCSGSGSRPIRSAAPVAFRLIPLPRSGAAFACAANRSEEHRGAGPQPAAPNVAGCTDPATADSAKPAPAPPTSSPAPSSTPVNGAASNPPLQSASLPVNVPVEQILIPP